MFGDTEDEVWLWLNMTGRELCPWLSDYLPGLADPELRERLTGMRVEVALRDGFNFYRLCKELFERYAAPLSDSARVLDFGCGWGRIIRFFLRDIEPTGLVGVDVSEEAIAACRETNQWCSFEQIHPFPPIGFDDASFDLIFLYSVFSHLTEQAHLQWLAEFDRILKAGGVLIATTWPRDYIELCAKQSQSLTESSSHRERMMARAFPDHAAALREYDSGQFCFGSIWPDHPYFGEACIPRAYVEREWTTYFKLLEYIDDRSRCVQDAIVVNKPKLVTARKPLLKAETSDRDGSMSRSISS
jgi:SAM-dependent methyltransferase